MKRIEHRPRLHESARGRSWVDVVRGSIVGRRSENDNGSAARFNSDSKNDLRRRAIGTCDRRRAGVRSRRSSRSRRDALIRSARRHGQEARRTTYCASVRRTDLASESARQSRASSGLLDVLLGALPGVVEGAGLLEIGAEPPAAIGRSASASRPRIVAAVAGSDRLEQADHRQRQLLLLEVGAQALAGRRAPRPRCRARRRRSGRRCPGCGRSDRAPRRSARRPRRKRPPAGTRRRSARPSCPR